MSDRDDVTGFGPPTPSIRLLSTLLGLLVSFCAPAALAEVAVLTLNVDNADVVYFNGERIGSDGSWRDASRYELNALPGTNVLAVRGRNTGGPGGLLAELEMNGVTLLSDSRWKVSTDQPDGWYQTTFDDSDWATATEHGAYRDESRHPLIGFPQDSAAQNIWLPDVAATGLVYFRLTFGDSDSPAPAPPAAPAPAPPALVVETPSLPDAAVGAVYSHTLRASGGMPPYVWAITDGTLPVNLTLDGGSGEIRGQPTESGNSDVTFEVTDYSGQTSAKTLALDVIEMPSANSGSLILNVDDADVVYFNGERIGSDGSWREASRYELDPFSGPGVLAIRGRNTGGPGALLAELEVNGVTFLSDSRWKVSTNAPDGWQEVTFDDSGWAPATEHGAYRDESRQRLLGFPTDSAAQKIWLPDATKTGFVYFRLTIGDDNSVVVESPSPPPPANGSDGATISLTSGATATIRVDAVPGGAVVIVEGPRHGTLRAVAADTFEYSPDPGFWGADSFVYQSTTVTGIAISSVVLDVTCTDCPNSVALSIVWDPSYWLSETGWQPAEGYVVFFGTEPGNVMLEIANLSGIDDSIDLANPSLALDAYADLGLREGDQACFRIRAYAWILTSDPSPAVCTVI